MSTSHSPLQKQAWSRRSSAVRVAFLLLQAVLLVAGACSQSDAAPVAEGANAADAIAARLLVVSAADFRFQAQRTVPAGLTRIRLVNQGRELHHAQLVRMQQGHTVQELLAEMAKTETTPEWATLVGGPNAPAPGGTSEAILDLAPGEYALVCFIPSGDGVPHAARGMAVPLTVTGTPESRGTEPVADLDVSLVDYSFDFARELTAGRHVIRVRNDAGQPHEIFIARLAPGKGAGDLLGWLEKQQGPPPAEPVGGTTFLAGGEVNYLVVDLAPGEYALYCFVPDARDGQPHVAHGMIRQITAR